MKTTKFRAYHIKEQKMCKVTLINFELGAFLEGVNPGEDQVQDKYFVPAPTNGRFCEWDEFELMQFTGLVDKNGVDIWEGSIIKELFYDCNQGETYVISDVTFGGGAFNPVCSAPEDEYEVIGNVHQNPELLK